MGICIAEETKKDKVIEQLSQREYRKSYENLNTIEKERIVQNYEKRERIYILGTKAGMQESSKYKEHMEMVGKEQVMRLFLEKHRDGIVISKKEMQSYYDAHKQDYTTVHAYTLVRKNEKELDAYLKVLKSSSKAELEQTFITLAKKHSQHPNKEKGGDMGFVGYTTIVKPFGKETFALKDNSYTIKPFKTVLGWHIVYAKEKKVISFEKVKKSIEDNLRTKTYIEWFKAL
jgi:parvulin-like peptidyl-prolyl isomerase